MKKIVLFLCLILLLINSSCKRYIKKEMKSPYLSINPILDNIVIQKKTGGNLTDDEIYEIKLILSCIIYCDNNYANAIYTVEPGDIDQNEYLVLDNTCSNICNHVLNRTGGELKIKSDENIFVVTANLVRLCVKVWANSNYRENEIPKKYEVTNYMLSNEAQEIYRQDKEKVLKRLYEYFEIKYDDDLKKYFDIND